MVPHDLVSSHLSILTSRFFRVPFIGAGWEVFQVEKEGKAFRMGCSICNDPNGLNSMVFLGKCKCVRISEVYNTSEDGQLGLSDRHKGTERFLHSRTKCKHGGFYYWHSPEEAVGVVEKVARQEAHVLSKLDSLSSAPLTSMGKGV